MQEQKHTPITAQEAEAARLYSNKNVWEQMGGCRDSVMDYAADSSGLSFEDVEKLCHPRLRNEGRYQAAIAKATGQEG